MKRKSFTLFNLLFVIAIRINAQVPVGEYLDINNIKVLASCDGTLGWNGSISYDGFEFPKNSGKIIGAANSLWIGGLDNGGILHAAAMTYRQMGKDFFQGPKMNSSSYSVANDNLWNKAWKINKTTIDSFVVFTQTGLPVGYITPQVIVDWPANGNISLGQSAQLAPYYDINGDNYYNPIDGDYPLIRGDQAVFFLFNDDRNTHTETSTQKLGIEVKGMIYGFSCVDSAIEHTIYANYQITNKSVTDYDSVYVGNWLDADNYGGDFFGTDVGRGSHFFYGTNSSLGMYGYNKPSIGVVFLNGPPADSNGVGELVSTTPHGFGYGDGIVDNERPGISKSLAYNNMSSPLNGNPGSGLDYYNYLNGNWKNGAQMTYGNDGLSGSTTCNYMYPNDSDSLSLGVDPPQAPWNNHTSSPLYVDRRAVGSYGPFSFKSNQTIEIDLAYVIGRDYSDTSFWAPVSVLKQRIDCARAFYENNFLGCGCSSEVGIQNPEKLERVICYPNPVSTNLHINYISESNDAILQVSDIAGRVVLENVKFDKTQTLDVSNLNPGIYFLKLSDGKNTSVQRFIKQ